MKLHPDDAIFLGCIGLIGVAIIACAGLFFMGYGIIAWFG